jgi:hypothetical protein
MSTMITRRVALMGAAASSLALAVPTVAAVAPVEHPWVKARRLAKELSETLAAIDDGDMLAVVEPHGSTHPVMFMNGGAYRQRWSQVMTDDQAQAVAEWQLVTVEQADQWALYCKPQKSVAREDAYAVWQGIYRRQQEAHAAMIRAFYPEIERSERRAAL